MNESESNYSINGIRLLLYINISEEYSIVHPKKYALGDLTGTLRRYNQQMAKQIASNKVVKQYIDKSFVPDINLDEEDYQRIVEKAGDALELMDDICALIADGYKLTVNRTREGTSICATLTHTNADHKHGKQILAGFAETPAVALSCLMYKFSDILGGGDWPAKGASKGIR